MVSYRMIAIGFSMLTLVLGAPLNEKCIYPTVKAEVSPLFVYRELDVIDVKVYHCYFYERSTYHVCKGGYIQDGTPKTTNGTGYAYPTRECLNAAKTGQVSDKYGYGVAVSVNRTTNRTLHYDCNNDTALTKDIMFTLKEYSARVDLTRDVITLHSGTSCKYSYGFCYDPRPSADLVWEVQTKGAPNCSRLSKITLSSDAYKLILDKITYLVTETDNGFVILKLNEEREVCGVDMWKTAQEDVFVSQKHVEGATLGGSVNKGDYGFLYFQDKPKMYDFVIKMCHSENYNPTTFELAYDGFKTSSEVERLSFQIKRLAVELDEYKASSESKELLLYVNIVVIYVAGIVGIFLCKQLAKSIRKRMRNGRSATGAVKRNVAEEVRSDDSSEQIRTYDMYESITAEYDINSLYSNK